MWDLNANVGRGQNGEMVNKYSSQRKKEFWCTANGQVIINIWLKRHLSINKQLRTVPKY